MMLYRLSVTIVAFFFAIAVIGILDYAEIKFKNRKGK